MPIGTCTLMTAALRGSIREEALNTSFDLGWIVKDFLLNIGSTIEVASDMTLTQCRFPLVTDVAGTLSSTWTFVCLPCEWARMIATGIPIDLRNRLPCGQLNFMLNPLSVLFKAHHWMRQG